MKQAFDPYDSSDCEDESVISLHSVDMIDSTFKIMKSSSKHPVSTRSIHEGSRGIKKKRSKRVDSGTTTVVTMDKLVSEVPTTVESIRAGPLST